MSVLLSALVFKATLARMEPWLRHAAHDCTAVRPIFSTSPNSNNFVAESKIDRTSDTLQTFPTAAPSAFSRNTMTSGLVLEFKKGFSTTQDYK
eukprot:5808895-Amphidinium_carterae.1